MTEKRFTLSGVALNNPNAIRDDKELLTQKEVVDKLNGLYCSNLKLLKSNDFLLKENERLKKERNHFERKKTEYLTEWNACRIKNTELRKDNLQAFALLGDIRALARTSDIETIIKKINKFEKEVVK